MKTSPKSKCIKTSIGPAVWILAVMFAATSAFGASLISNGSFESWGTVSGTPPTGVPTSWSMTAASVVNPIRGEGLVDGSTYSAIMQSGMGSSSMFQIFSEPQSDFSISFVVAAATTSNNNGRSFQTLFNTATGTTYINLRLASVVANANLTLQAFNGSSWVSLSAVEAFLPSVFNSAQTGFDTLNAYNFSVDVDLASVTPSYSITYGLVGGETTTLSGLTAFATTPTLGAVIERLDFTSGSSAGKFAVDNVAVIPEPGTVALLGSALLGVMLVRRCRKA